MTKYKKRTEMMERLYTKEGMTLEQIAQRYKISRERVRQILSKVPSYVALDGHHNGSMPRRIFKCWCGKEIEVAMRNRRQFCSRKCRAKHVRMIWATFETKRCRGCHLIKRRDQFFFKKSGEIKGQPYTRCKTCRAKYTTSWQEANPKWAKEIRRKAAHNYYIRHKKLCQRRQREWVENNRDYVNARERVNYWKTHENNKKTIHYLNY